MKTMLLASSLALCSAASTASALSTIENCIHIVGSYSCAVDGELMPLQISINKDENLVIQAESETDTVIVDGLEHPRRNATYKAVCSPKKSFTSIDTYQNRITTIGIAVSPTGVDYTIMKEGKPTIFACTKK